MFQQITEAVGGRKTVNPRTVLGFYATVLGLALTAVVGATGVLAATDTATYLIPWIVVFGGALLILLLVAVFVLTMVDPSKLMLGQISGTEYAYIRQAVLGSSTTGERIELIRASASALPTDEVQGLVASEPVRELEAGDQEEEE
ncbi:hypothetical protein AB0H57_10440 [Micromonospora sp. NPDC050686]|uniref:hypothetical protein n=1 Tax=Micromonospora sp. NPDC050686 TaxID=3154631 RepID=UPI0033E21B00